ncbi:hypothetical protein [Okeania sp. SIO2B3]|uniref:hypothetical protein n=1 Tax=Okeania sp. SIO2B3 TaxID=2607784 RepID=UPI0013BF071C|nr:hypothetical protein [Okeania sp. SIO2B3]NET44889.1 hypothetical protein [Okeania sp. SIO2B3]
MGLKIIESFESSFTLEQNGQQMLFKLLTSENFIQQITSQLPCQKLEFTELIFQPVPYSKETPKGMAKEFEQYHESSDYIIINVPPNFMFQAKIFKPSRLCAIYKIVGGIA